MTKHLLILYTVYDDRLPLVLLFQNEIGVYKLLYNDYASFFFKPFIHPGNVSEAPPLFRYTMSLEHYM